MRISLPNRLLATLLFGLSASACNAPAITAGLAGAQLSSRGSFGATESGAVVRSDMRSLGLAQTDNTLLPRLYLRDGARLLEVSGFDVDLAGTGTVEADITLNGTTLSANTDVASRFGMSAYSGVLTWDVARLGPTLIGVGVGLEWVALDVGLEEISGSLTLSSEQQFPVPLIGVRITSEEAPVSAHLALGWITLQTPEVRASVLDVDGRLEATLVGGRGGLKVQGMLGYRGFDMDVGYDDGASQIEADFKIGGPYAGLRVSF